MEFSYTEFIEEYLETLIYIIPIFTQIGIPLGLTFLGIWKGSLIQTINELIISIILLTIVLTLSNLIAYYIGKKHSKYIHNKIQKNKNLNKITPIVIKNPFLSLILTRTILLGLAPITNYLFGIEKVKLKKFIYQVFIAELIYSTLILSLGYIFSDTWELIVTLIEDFTLIIILALILIYTIKKLYNLVKKTKK
jgi:membrane protein DedA with SNARE-associated domain